MLNDNLKKAFEIIKNGVIKEMTPKDVFDDFIANLKINKIIYQKLYILVNNQFAKSQLDSKYKDIFTKELKNMVNDDYELVFITSLDEIDDSEWLEEAPVWNKLTKNDTNLISEFSFESLIKGKFNEHLVKVADAIVKQKILKKVFLYGPVGVGKTHFLHALGNLYKQENPTKVVKYLYSSDFMNEVHDAAEGKGNRFNVLRNKYDHVDLLLFDDFQFIENKNKTAEIFFSIYNRLVENNKIIVVASDCLINKMVSLPDRLKSRLSSHTQVLINEPTEEDLRLILNLKLNNLAPSYKFDQESINYIVRRCPKDVRALEGILNTILFNIQINNGYQNEITIDQIRSIMETSELTKNDSKWGINPDTVITFVCQKYHVPKELTISAARKKEINFPRRICMYILKEKLNMTYAEIGHYFANRNHATIIEAINKVKKELSSNQEAKDFVENLMKDI